MRNLSKASALSKKKVEQLVQFKTSYTKFGHSIRRFRRLQEFSKHITEICCMDLAIVEKIASQNNGVKILLVASDIVSRFVVFQTLKTKYAKNTLQAVKKKFSRKNTTENFELIKEKKMGKLFKKSCEKKDTEVYTTLSETKAAFAERAMQSLKHITYRYM